MKYNRLLALMPAQLRLRLEAETVYAPWLARGATLEELWNDEVVLETLYNRLSPLERTVLDTIVRRIGCVPFDDILLERSVGAIMSGAELRAGLAGLRRKGLVFAFRKAWGELVYVLPDDGFMRWQRIVCPGLSAAMGGQIARRELEIEASASRGREPAMIVLEIAAYAARHELKLTKHGTLHKKTIERLEGLLPWDGARLAGSALKYAFADVYDLPVALALDWMLKLGLLHPEHEVLRVQEKAIREFLACPRSHQNKRLFECWKESTWPAPAWLQHAAQWVEALEEGVWFSAIDLVHALQSADVLSTSEDALNLELHVDMLIREWLEPLTALGWLEEGREVRSVNPNEAKPIYYRWLYSPFCGDTVLNINESESGGFIVQPDFEILVPPDVDSRVHWELHCMAESLTRDVLSVYKLTKASLQFALEQGRSVEEIAGFLTKHAVYGVPDNVSAMIAQWSKPFGKTAIKRVVLLACDDAATAAALIKLPNVAKYLREPLGDSHFLVNEADMKGLASALEKADFMPEFSSTESEASRSRRYPRLDSKPDEGLPHGDYNGLDTPVDAGLVYPRHSLAYYPLEAKLPEVTDLYPELKEIPAHWLRDYRNYHPSTRKDIVERAIQLGTVIQLRRNGSDVRVAPRKIQETRGTWCLTGFGCGAEEGTDAAVEVRMLADEWQEMKLILPGVNDKL